MKDDTVRERQLKHHASSSDWRRTTLHGTVSFIFLKKTHLPETSVLESTEKSKGGKKINFPGMIFGELHPKKKKKESRQQRRKAGHEIYIKINFEAFYYSKGK